jgi:hypothetical protein
MAMSARNMTPSGHREECRNAYDVGHAVLLENVDLRDGRYAALGVGQHDLAALGAGGQRVAGNGLDGMFAAILVDHGHQRRGIHFGRHDVVGQDPGELGLVLRLEQGLDGSRRQGCERRVGRREYRERTGTLERVDQTRRLDGGNERRVILRIHGIVDDVLRRIHRRTAHHHGLLLRHGARCGDGGACQRDG